MKSTRATVVEYKVLFRRYLLGSSRSQAEGDRGQVCLERITSWMTANSNQGGVLTDKVGLGRPCRPPTRTHYCTVLRSYLPGAGFTHDDHGTQRSTRPLRRRLKDTTTGRWADAPPRGPGRASEIRPRLPIRNWTLHARSPGWQGENRHHRPGTAVGCSSRSTSSRGRIRVVVYLCPRSRPFPRQRP